MYRVLPELRTIPTENLSEFLQQRSGDTPNYRSESHGDDVNKRGTVYLLPDLLGISELGGPICLALIVLFSGLLLVLFLGWWFLFEVPLVLLEVAIQYQFANLAVRTLRSVPPYAWFKTLLLKTMALFFLFVIGGSLLGMEIHRRCPNAEASWECFQTRESER